MKRFFLTTLFMCLFFSISTLADVEVYFVPYVGDIDGSVDTGWFSFYEQLRQWHDDNLIPVGLSFYPETMNNQRFNQIIADMYMSNSVELILKGEDEYGGKRIDLMPYEEAKQALEAWQNKFVAELENLGYSNIKKPVTYNQLMGKFTENIRDAAHELGFKIYLEQYVSEYGNIDMLPDFDITQYSVSLTTSVEAGPNTEFKTPERVIQELLDFNDGHLIYINGVKVVPLLSHQQDFRISYGSSTVDQQKWDIYTGLLLMARDDPRIYLLKPEEVYDLRHPSAAICGNNIVEYGEQCDDGNNINGDGCSSTCQTEGKGKVIFSMDDSQLNWLEDIAVAVTEINIEEGIDIVLNVIPYRISASNVLGPKLQEWNNNYKDFIEIAEHGYTHDRNEYNMGSMSYNQQRTIIENGLNELRLLGIEPKLFTPPGGSQNANTLNVLGDLGLHTDLDCWTGIDSSSGILVLKQCGALLCDVYGVSGPNCNFKSTSALMNDIDNMINNYGYAVVAFHMQDFETSSGRLDTSKINEYRQLLRNLKDLGKYQFMTAEEFYRGTIAECGNGILETGEECDDGNLLSGDGCSSDCKIELSACVDGDSDGYYAVDTGCLVGNDCDDANITINPGASETECDGVNNDCDGDIDEDYAETQTTCGVGACSANGLLQCVDGNEIDSCTPGIPAANDSSCDGIDDDCDGTNDEDYVSQQTSCGIGACYATGLTSCVGGLIKDSCMPGQPQPEVCEGLIDEDCDGLIDLEDSDCFNCIDNDNDNHYSMEGYCPNSDDCDDNNNTIYPGASEAGCDGVDNDCDDLIDEDYVITGTSCGIGACYARGELSCLGGVEVDSCTPGIPALNDSTCDGIDDDCDGIIDEDCKPVCGVCVNSTMVCPDGFIAECGNTCDELTGLCSNCTPSCEGHEEVVYREVLYTFKVSSWNDDAFEYNNNVNINGAAIGMGNRRYGGFRFNNVDIPKGAIIEDARLSLAYNWASSSTVNLILYGEDSDNAEQFQSISKDITSRARTSRINWNGLKKVGWGNYIVSPNMSSIVQSIIDRQNWQEGNSMVILGYPSNNRIWEAVSYEGTNWNYGLYSARLEIKALIPTISQNPDQSNNTNSSGKIVIVQFDDCSNDWLEDTCRSVVDLHIQKNADIVIGFIPVGIVADGSWETSLKDWNENHKGVVEIAQHTYDHSSQYVGWSAEAIANDMQLGLNEFAQWGIRPYTFVPAYGWAENTAEGAGIAGFHSVLDGLANPYDRGFVGNVLVIHDGVYCGDGYDSCANEDYATLKALIDNKIDEKGYANIMIHQGDFGNVGSSQYNTIYAKWSDNIDRLKNDGYIFMTTEDYYYEKFYKSKNYAGVRSTLFGYQQEEEPDWWVNKTSFVLSKVNNSVPSMIYGIGGMLDSPPGNYYLNFPSTSTYPYISFSDTDENERYLAAYDNAGFKVWVQVEPGLADVNTLIDLILSHYKNHSCIIGFGVDVEWLGHPTYLEGRQVTNTEVADWLNKIKSYNTNYKLFLKHWEPDKMPTSYPPDVVFIDDSEQNGNFSNLAIEFSSWGNRFNDTEVGFQVGYPSDKEWWGQLNDPVNQIGTTLSDAIPNMKYYYWVDFSIKDV